VLTERLGEFGGTEVDAVKAAVLLHKDVQRYNGYRLPAGESLGQVCG
jgi:hypothetical protein